METILVLHGPNLNLLGTRQVDVYGLTTLAAIDDSLRELAAELGVEVDCHQSNHEGELLDRLHAARATHAGVLFNFGAYTHTSIALGDALRAIPLPAVEVHLSNVHAREAFRAHSHTASAAVGVVTGFGADSYSLGLRALIGYLRRTDG
ncbi:MAG: type II 3-dehydroquinate dehydratase [Sandaracinus sp.]|nr:type II 3-dehydroquinate dehydratase [Sandaracinus sp.]|tara:strand:+ start:1755 stop:2201 length:447 start_codon:yes stop_codon:yes gene_type:complete